MYYNRLNENLRQLFGCKVYKLAIDGGFTCPNRDGTCGTKGCIFCSGRGSGDFAEPFSGNIRAQLEKAKALVAAKNRGGKYIAYFQSFTNTYAPVSRLRELFCEAISDPEVVALSVATRPDCLEPEKVELLRSLSAIKPVSVELGLQTVKESTAEYIRRGYPLAVFDDAVKRLKAAGLETVVHMILGLPNETDEDIYATARYISDSGADGIKLQLLHVIKGTDLYSDYIARRFEVLSLEKYAELLAGCIRRLRPEIVIHRLTGDGAKRDLAAPLWSADKKHVLNYINAYFRENNVIQGSLTDKTV